MLRHSHRLPRLGACHYPPRPVQVLSLGNLCLGNEVCEVGPRPWVENVWEVAVCCGDPDAACSGYIAHAVDSRIEVEDVEGYELRFRV
jgi:hypothetical protein